MKIEAKKFVALSYKLNVDGAIADEASKENPLKFVYGAGFLLPKFEENIAGKSVGDVFEFTLSAKDGYGEMNEQLLIDVPKSAFMVNGQVEEGLLTIDNQIPMMTGTGQQVVGRVTEVTDDNVKMDFNHPMAGKTLNFSGEIVEVRDATDEDYPHHAHGCDCGCDHDDCNCGEGECGKGCGCE